MLKIATWNINSVRLRLGLVERFLTEFAPDILCLQETKCPDDRFPRRAFEALGYGHVAIHGQRGYHGVATVSRIAFDNVERRHFCGKADARHIATTLAPAGAPGVTVHNFYVPSGGDEPDPELNDKFAHKLEFLDELGRWFAAAPPRPRQILVGDLNVAPLDNDVWSHRQLLKVVSHTPVEVERLLGAQSAGGWIDVMGAHVPADQKLFTWWSYRARDWRASNRGRRLDHVWATPDFAPCSTAVSVVDAARDWERPSDHAPVLAEFDLGRRPPPA